LFTCRLQLPAPRSSAGTRSAGPYRAGRRVSQRAAGSANLPPASLATIASASLGR
jgi:hypothetical protein